MKIHVTDYVLGLIPVTKELQVEKWTTVAEVRQQAASSVLPNLGGLLGFGGQQNELSGGGHFLEQPAVASFWGGGSYGDKRTLETCGISDGDVVDLHRL